MGPLKLYWFSAEYYRILLEGYQTICFLCKRPTSFIESINQWALYSSHGQDHPKRTSADMELRNYPKYNIYLYNYQADTAIFLAAKHEKQLWHVVV